MLASVAYAETNTYICRQAQICKTSVEKSRSATFVLVSKYFCTSKKVLLY